MARFRPSKDGRGPLGRDTGANASVRPGVPTQRLALKERKPRHLCASVVILSTLHLTFA
jgi:hypothetical protein